MSDLAIKYNPNGDSFYDIEYGSEYFQKALDGYREDLLIVISKHVRTEIGEEVITLLASVVCSGNLKIPPNIVEIDS
ncbi:MAG: hypothetical protein HRT38_17560, partial [Alteromonadaceae bacterium]|nr:hypothetical protein [Alteromonadaceae bacterium]